ncbi:MAG: SRPBCC family protein [Polyangiaceae bacterium]
MSDGRTTRSFAAGAVAEEMPAPEAPPSEPTATYQDPSGVQGTGLPIANSDLVRGSATVVVDAPLPKVRETVLGFADYAEFMPHYQKSKLLGRTPAGARDIYMEIAAMHGAVKMWARLEVTVKRDGNGPSTPSSEGGVETVHMRSVEGNVKELSGTWRMEADGADKTKLTLEVFLSPSLPLPSSVLNAENVKGAVKGVVAMKKRAEGAR